MRVLIVKTSSMGDIIHTLPALTDAARKIPNIQFDWVVEEGFQEIPLWHSKVNRIIPVQFRKWRKDWFNAVFHSEISEFIHSIRKEKYDLIIDAQGLLKSILISLFAKGPRAGYSWFGIKEPLASLFYQKKTFVSWKEHAVFRARKLFASSLNYEFTQNTPDYGIDLNKIQRSNEPIQTPFIVFLHGTTWPTKHWPENYWIALGAFVVKAGFQIRLLWGNATERERAIRIAEAVPGTVVMPKLKLAEVAELLSQAKAVVSVDTGLAHLTAALSVPCISLYGPTDISHSGTVGKNQIHLTANYACVPCKRRKCNYSGTIQNKAACFASLPPEVVWSKLNDTLSTNL